MVVASPQIAIGLLLISIGVVVTFDIKVDLFKGKEQKSNGFLDFLKEKERIQDNDGLDPSEEYLEKRQKVMMRIPISLQKNQNFHIINEFIDLLNKFLYIRPI